jgi:hypothetical protein
MATKIFAPGVTIDSAWLNDINTGVYTDIGGPGGLSKSTGSGLVGFQQSGAGLTATWTVATKLQEFFISAADSVAGTVAGKIDAAIAAAAGRIVVIPPGMGAGEGTTYSVGQAVWDLRAPIIGSGQGGKVMYNFQDSGGHIRFLVIDDQTNPTMSANAAALFNHRPTGALPAGTCEGAHCIGATTGTLTSVGAGFVLSGIEGGVNVGSNGQTIPDAWGITANSTLANVSTNVTRLVSLYAQAPIKGGLATGIITNAYSIVAEDPGAIASSDNLSLWAKGAVRIGPKAAGSINATLSLDGGDAPSAGVVVTLLRNGTPVGDIATEGALLGGASSDLLFNRRTSGSIKMAVASVTFATFNATSVNLTAGTVYAVAGTQVLGPRVTGYTNALAGVANRATAYNTATITLQQLAERVKAIEDDALAHGWIGA